MPKTLYLIDGHAQIYRSYYAPFRPLTSPTGEPTRATYVFCQALLNLIRDRKPDYLAMVLDADERKLHRLRIYPQYKAHREPPPEDLPAQEERIVSILAAARVPLLRREGYEADDIIATLARRLAGADSTRTPWPWSTASKRRSTAYSRTCAPSPLPRAAAWTTW